jgi:hypothetical protein
VRLSFCIGYRILVLYTMQNRSFIQGDSYEYCNSFEVNLCFFFCLCCFYFFYLETVTKCFFLDMIAEVFFRVLAN